MYLQKTAWKIAKKQEYNGHIYDSKFEAQRAIELDLLKKGREIKDWERQVILPLEVNGFKICTYKIDYVVHHNDGTIEYEETKGYATPVWRLKWKLFEALYSEKPGVKLTVIQQGKFRVPKAKKIKKKL